MGSPAPSMSGTWNPAGPGGYGGPTDADAHRHRWMVPVAMLVVLTVVVIGFLLWLSFFGPVHAGGYYLRGWFFFPFGFLFLLFVLFFGVRIAFWSYRWGDGGRRSRRYGPSAILRARYARGEITRDQFLQMQRDLDDSR